MAEYTSILLEVHYLPNIQYFSKFLLYDQVILEAFEHYAKGSYRNRSFIAGVNGPLMLSIPLKRGKNQQMPITATQISYDMPWQSHHWHSIKSAYGNAPYFDYYADELKPFFNKKVPNLFEWNTGLIKKFLELLDLEKDFQLTKKYEMTLESTIYDGRNQVHPKKKLTIDPNFKLKPYAQVFKEKTGFLGNLSILDLIFCTGPQAIDILMTTIPNKY